MHSMVTTGTKLICGGTHAQPNATNALLVLDLTHPKPEVTHRLEGHQDVVWSLFLFGMRIVYF